MVLKKTLDHLLDSKEIKPVNPKEINPEYSFKGLMLKLKLQYLGHLMGRADSLGKNPDDKEELRAGGEGVTDIEMFGWHHRLNGYEFEQTPKDSEG